MSRDVDFLTFFIMWARLQGWVVPMLHVRICVWLEHCVDPERVLMVFRGAAKSTIYAVYKAWKLYRNRSQRSLVWSADNETAGMLTADTINVLRNHPLCAGMLTKKPGAKRFWVIGARDARNPSMRANGVNSNATGARADDVDFDDIEVPGNIETPEARKKLRDRISESTHIAVPGAQKTFIGTPHAHDSIYPERIKAGAATLIIPLFELATRYTKTDERTRYKIRFEPAEDGLYVIAGIHTGARMLREGVDYQVEAGEIVFAKPPRALVDVYSGCAWPERFTRAEIEIRRRETRTINAWDSQYMLEAKPLTEVRLDPARITPYAVPLTIRRANNAVALFLGKVQIVAAACRWDPSSGKLKSDLSGVGVVLQDDGGRRYIHRVAAVRGEIAEFASDGKTIVGGQVWQLCDLIEELHIPRVSVETNGIGGFAPTVLRAAITQRRKSNPKLQCAVVEVDSTTNKNKRILEAFEPLLLSRGMLWAHMDVLVDPDTKEKAPFWAQMRDWNPGLTDQPDDLLDAVAGAISETPERFRAIGGISPSAQPEDWRPTAGVYEVAFDR
ncbi:phage terminase large subunit [Pseudoxanthomonas mexicana]|uniref:phage terminase large subunit n=1 Tax=Pseudoxanthomonas mexicana TaxID=128785 RepID=UPI0028AA3F40|nr:phage terminase large subunit [Pseudoxanthomonas mexicana]